MSVQKKSKKQEQDELIFNYLHQFEPLMRFPYEWIYAKPLCDVSGRALHLYQFLWSRKVVSLFYRQFDKRGRPYVICSREEAAKYLLVSRATAGKCFKELRNNNLIDENDTEGYNMIFINDVIPGNFYIKRIDGKLVRSNSDTTNEAQDTAVDESEEIVNRAKKYELIDVETGEPFTDFELLDIIQPTDEMDFEQYKIRWKDSGKIESLLPDELRNYEVKIRRRINRKKR